MQEPPKLRGLQSHPDRNRLPNTEGYRPQRSQGQEFSEFPELQTQDPIMLSKIEPNANLDQPLIAGGGRSIAAVAITFPRASTWAVVFRFVTFNVLVILVDSAMNSRLLRSLTGNSRE